MPCIRLAARWLGTLRGVSGGTDTVQGRFEPTPTTPGRARRLVRQLLTDADRADLLDAAELVVSELVTNALLHTASAIDVSARVDADGLLLEVFDESASLPAERGHDVLAGTGRGLALVHELTAGWGARRTSSGKVVWARVGASDTPAPVDEELVEGRDSSVADHDADGSAVSVVLRNVPLLMHLAWHEHAETVLREYLLARLEHDEAAALAEHAVASSAMALLHDQVPIPDLPGGAARLGDVTELLTAVVEPAASLAEGLLRLPHDEVVGFATLDAVMDAALVLADADELLAAPIQPELRELRRWLCGQVETQSAGGEPVPWAPPPSLTAPGTRVPASDWDREPVDRSVDALVAADDTNRIIAISRPALDLLGYDDAADLIGQRLLALIPQRYHQGHLAGFTRYLTHGWAPLIGTPAVVPFARADGTETLLRLLIDVVAVGDGRRVFVAALGDEAPTPT